MGRVSEGPKRERFGFIAEHHPDFGIRYLCRKLNVSPQGYYRWANRVETCKEVSDRDLLKRIKSIYEYHNGNYGSPRICAELKFQGEVVNHKRVERLMREAGLVGKAGRIYRRKPAPGNSCIKVPNLKRELGSPSGINKQWAGDVTYLKVNGEMKYLAVIMDLYSRKIIGWELSENRTVDLTLSALNKALRSRTVEKGLIFHSDRGSEYGAHVYQARLRAAGIEPSMNRPGCMNDNVHVETFFQTMKTESFKQIEFDTFHELRMTLSWYMDSYYNIDRRHSAIGFQSPDEYERMAA